MTTTTLSMMVGASKAAPVARVPGGVTPADVAEGFATLLARVGRGDGPVEAASVEDAPHTATADDVASEPATEGTDDHAVPVTVSMVPAVAPTATPARGPVPTGGGDAPTGDLGVRADDTATSIGPDLPPLADGTTTALEDTAVPDTIAPDPTVATPTTSDDTAAGDGAADVTPEPTTDVTPEPTPEPVIGTTSSTTVGTAEDEIPTDDDLRAPPLRGRPADGAHGNGRAVGPPPPDAVAEASEAAPSGPRPALLDAGSRASEVASPVAIERVLRAVEALENAPPPRRMTFDVDGVRVAVSLTGRDVTVDLGGDRRLPQDLARALADRGFDLAGESGRHGAPDDDRAPARRWREEAPGPALGQRPRAVRVADDLRL